MRNELPPTGNQLMTVGEIARLVQYPLHRVLYAIRRYGVEPRQRAGVMRLFGRDQLPTIVAAIRRVQEAAHV